MSTTVVVDPVGFFEVYDEVGFADDPAVVFFEDFRGGCVGLLGRVLRPIRPIERWCRFLVVRCIVRW